MNVLAVAPKTERIKKEAVGQCFARPAADDAELRWLAGVEGGGGLTLGRQLDSVWEGLLAAGAAGCPVCGARMERGADAAGRCGDCGSSLT